MEWNEQVSINTRRQRIGLLFPGFCHRTNRKGSFFIQPSFDSFDQPALFACN